MDSSLRQSPAAVSPPSDAQEKVVPIGRRTRKVVAATPLRRPVLANLAAAITLPFTSLPDSDICKPPLMAARGEFEPGGRTPPRRL